MKEKGFSNPLFPGNALGLSLTTEGQMKTHSLCLRAAWALCGAWMLFMETSMSKGEIRGCKDQIRPRSERDNDGRTQRRSVLAAALLSLLCPWS